MDFVYSVKDVWDELTDMFSSVNGHRVYQMLKGVHALEHADLSVEIYYHKLKNLRDKYSALEPSFVCKYVITCEAHKQQEERHQRRTLL